MIHAVIRRLAFALMLWLPVMAVSVQAQPPVTVFAAASLKTALDDVIGHYRVAGGGPVLVSYAGSSALARQIQYGAPAQIFISANSAWMDALADEGLIDDLSRVDLLTNRLVLIIARGAQRDLAPAPEFDLSGALGDERLAMALVDAVPAGIYGRAALRSLGVWDSVSSRIAQADSARGALRLVAVGEAPMGIVYATDAAAEPQVRVLGLFPAQSHPDILYPAALLRDGVTDESTAFFAFLIGPQARMIFDRHGFGRPETPS